MKIIKFIKLSSGKEEYFSDYGPVKSLFEAKQLSEDKAKEKVDSFKKSEFRTHYNIIIEDFTKEMMSCQDKFENSVKEAKRIFASKGFKVD